MKKSLFFALILFFSISFSTVFNAQGEKIFVTVNTVDGNQYSGTVVSENDEFIELSTEALGVLKIMKINIESRSEAYGRMKGGKLWLDNTQSTRYFWAPNGYNLRKGEGYYQNVLVLWNQASYGFTDNFSVGAGIIPLFLFGKDAAEYTPFFIIPKFSIPIKKDQINIGLGAVVGTAGFQDFLALPFGVVTIGNKEKNLTFGAGGFFLEGENSDPFFTVSGMLRVSRNTYLMSENYFITTPDVQTAISFGARSIFKRVSIDYGLIMPVPNPGIVGLPFLGITIPFGKKI